MKTMSQAIDGIDESASVVARVERIIPAPVEVIWSIHTDVEKWPEWQKDISTASAPFPLTMGCMIAWRTEGIDALIKSVLQRIEPPFRTVWSGTAEGIVGIHEWSFEPYGASTLVRTAESWSGDAIGDNAASLHVALVRSLERWLDFLTARAGGK